jgi:voltage-gated sodium channel
MGRGTEATAGGAHAAGEPEDGPPPGRLTAACARLAGSEWFQTAIIGVIVLNAIVLGLETYDTVDDAVGDELRALDKVFLAIFVFELAVRIGAYGRTPWRFFTTGWNIFDATIVAVAFVPGLSGSSTLLRLARLLRVARLIRYLPDVHVLLRGVLKSLPSIGGLIVLTLLLLFLYGMLGWSMFAEEDPERWGDIGEAMLTLFNVLTLEGWPDIFSAAREITPWAVPYMLSFILLGTFIVLNLVIGIVLTSMEEARAAHRLERDDPDGDLLVAIDDLKGQLEDLQRRLEHRTAGR